jgi:transposase
LLEAHARCTARLTDAHRAIGFALGGEAGARLADHLAMPTSRDTLLRRVQGAPDEPAPPPRFIGVDDWAVRKGQRYGTILIDLERGRVIDILPGRDGSALKQWLGEHPGVEVITRDRWAAYAQAAAEAAPQARQVADRWHLLKNLREAVERLFERHGATIREALRPTTREPPAPQQPAAVPPEQALAPTAAAEPSSSSPPEQGGSARRQRRAERYERVRQLHREGTSIRRIANTMRLSRGAVRRYLRDDCCPDWKPGRVRPTQLDGFRDHIDRRIQEGCRNAAELHRELAGQGCHASPSAVRRFAHRRLAALGQQRERSNAAPAKPPVALSARKLSFELIKRPAERDMAAQAHMGLLGGGEGELPEALTLAEEFAALARQESAVPLAAWLAKAAGSNSPEVRGFAEGLRQDETALLERWSNGPVEGQVNRLKVIKWQMYGRAGFRLLRARVRHSG